MTLINDKVGQPPLCGLAEGHRRYMTLGRLHVITDFHFQQRLDHAELARQAIAGGAEVIQFREKRGTMRSRLYELERTAAVCAELGVLLIVDDHVDLAMAVGAGGVHLGQEDMPVAKARQILGDGAIIGATASSASEARRAAAEGADYIGFGPVFPTTSKANPKPVRGLTGLAKVCREVNIPVIAIAGITPERVADVIQAGAHGIAVMTAITTAADVRAAAATFRRQLDSAPVSGHMVAKVMPETVDVEPQFPLAAEMKRKALHLFALVIPIGIILIEGPIDVIILASLAVIALAADFARVRVEWVKRAVEAVFAPLMRPTELEPIGGRVVINGATWMCTSAAICALVFPPVVAASALAILMVGDAAAAIVGRRFGRHSYAWSPKTIEGTLAFIVTGVLAAMPFAALVQPGVGTGAVMIAAVLGAALEASPLPINDNLKVPLAAGAAMMLLG